MAKQKTPTKKTVTPDPDGQDEGQDQEGTEGEESEGDSSEEENRRINAIVTSRVKREIKPMLTAMAQMQEMLKTLQTTPKKEETEEGDEEEAPTAKKAVEDPKQAKRLSRLEKELAEAKEAQRKAEQARVEEAEKAKRQEMRNIYQAALTEHGVTDQRLMRAALDQLEQDGYMIRDEEGKVKFKGADKYGIETNFDPKAGLKNWIQQEGKSFVPAVDAGGSGQGGSRDTKVNKGEFGKLSPAQKAAIEIDRASQGLPPLE